MEVRVTEVMLCFRNISLCLKEVTDVMLIVRVRRRS